MVELLARYPSLHRGEDEWRMLGRCYVDSFFPSPPKQAASCVLPGKQLVLELGSREKAASKGSQPVAFPNPSCTELRGGQRRKQDYQSCAPPMCLVCEACSLSN